MHDRFLSIIGHKFFFDYSCNLFLEKKCHLENAVSLTKRFRFAPASWSSGNAPEPGLGGLSFKSQTGQIEHSVANGSPPLQHFFEWSFVARAQ